MLTDQVSSSDPTLPSTETDTVQAKTLFARIIRYWGPGKLQVLVALCCAYLTSLVAAPIATTPYRWDDIINRTVPDSFDSTLWNIRADVEYIAQWIEPFLQKQGRLFPGSSIWTLMVMETFQTRTAYKLFLMMLSIAMIAIAATLVEQLAGWMMAAVLVAALTTTLTLRTWFDGLDSFTGILPLTVCLSFGAVLLLICRKGWPSGALAVFLWTYTLLTYEVAIILTPTFCLLVWFRTKNWWRTLPLSVPAVFIFGVVLLLRSMARGTDEAYSINLAPGPLLRTYLRQVAAALPLTQEWLANNDNITVDAALNGLLIVSVGIPVALMLILLGHQVIASMRVLQILAGLGATAWLFPPVFVAISTKWQGEVPTGQGYVAIVWEYIGVAMLLTAIWAAVAQAARGSTRWRIVYAVVTVWFAALCAFNIAQSITVATLVQVTAVN